MNLSKFIVCKDGTLYFWDPLVKDELKDTTPPPPGEGWGYCGFQVTGVIEGFLGV